MRPIREWRPDLHRIQATIISLLWHAPRERISWFREIRI
jgi:hypothetical protein